MLTLRVPESMPATRKEVRPDTAPVTLKALTFKPEPWTLNPNCVFMRARH